MSNLADAVQAAIFARLNAGVTLAPVFSVLPDGQKPPTVLVGESLGEQIGGKNSDHERHEITVRTFIAGTSKRDLFALMQQVKVALHNQPLVQAGFSMSRATLLSSSELRDLDDAALVGEQNFQVFISAA
jgi:hypothetical protein